MQSNRAPPPIGWRSQRNRRRVRQYPVAEREARNSGDDGARRHGATWHVDPGWRHEQAVPVDRVEEPASESRCAQCAQSSATVEPESRAGGGYNAVRQYRYEVRRAFFPGATEIEFLIRSDLSRVAN